MSIIEKLYISLANLHTLLTRYRGFEGTEDTNLVFAKADKIKMLPIDSMHHRQVCFLAYRLNLLQINAAPSPAGDITNDILANIKNAEWLAVHTRNLIYVQRADSLPVHNGITYSVVVVTVSIARGEQSNAKVRHAQDVAQYLVTSMREKNVAVSKARIVNLVIGDRPKSDVYPCVITPDVSYEIWYSEELQFNPLEHELVPEHVAWESLAADDIRRLPISTVRIATAGDVSKLDKLLESDIVARCHGFARGQVVCINRKQLFEGGTNSVLRYVE